MIFSGKSIPQGSISMYIDAHIISYRFFLFFLGGGIYYYNSYIFWLFDSWFPSSPWKAMDDCVMLMEAMGGGEKLWHGKYHMDAMVL